jgi:arsenate reductase
MAAAFFNRFADPTKARAISAGTQPASHVQPDTITTMRDVGIDLSNAETQLLTPELAAQAPFLITMGCGDECPVVPGAKQVDWPLDDPKGQPLEQVRRTRDEIRNRVENLIRQERWERDG